ncbi:MAG: mRNA cap guanine-N7 methyltransferase [Vezdaea acicularis]|nr:MAG: mRNA cap guanine-N7 methyltransferase [Vezdaea acicularis]
MASRRPRRSSPSSNTTLPPHQPPLGPLTPSQTRALSQLAQIHPILPLSIHLDAATSYLTDNAGELIDSLKRRENNIRRRQAQREKNGHPLEDAEEQEELAEAQERVEHMTSVIEERIRAVCDGEERVQSVLRALKEVEGNARSGRGQQNPRAQRRHRNNDDDEDTDAHDESFQPDSSPPPEATTPQSLPSIFASSLTTQMNAYTSKSLRDRYATTNTYTGFKRTIHDAQHPGENAPPVPHASTWFPPSPSHSPSAAIDPGRTTRHATTATLPADPHEHSSDSDLAISTVRTSLKCPLTLLPFVNPVTSVLCPHSFERSAIVGMISQSAARVGGNGRRGEGERAVKCPCCDQMLRMADLRSDPVLLRRVRRMQERREEEADEGEGEVENSVLRGRRAESVDGEEEDEDDEDVGGGGKRASRRVKRERLARRLVEESEDEDEDVEMG